MKILFVKWQKMCMAGGVIALALTGVAHARPVALPEPATLSLVGVAVAGVGAYFVLRKKK